MGGRLAGKTALITAAGQGIGRATALAMAQRRCHALVATDVNPELLEHYRRRRRRQHPRARRARRCRGHARRSTKRRRSPYCSIARASCTTARSSTARTKDWDFSFNLNVRAMYMTIKCALPRMLECARPAAPASSTWLRSRARSRAFPIASPTARARPPSSGLTKAVAADFVTKGIRCNAIAPGTVDTPSLHERINAFRGPGRGAQDFIARQPMGRLATPEEIAPVVVFLASDESAFATGNVYSGRRRHDDLTLRGFAAPSVLRRMARHERRIAQSFVLEPAEGRTSHRKTDNETRTLRPRRQGKARTDRRRRQAARPVAQGSRHRRDDARAGQAQGTGASSTPSGCRWSRASRASDLASRRRRSSSPSGSTTSITPRRPAHPIPEHPIVFFKSQTCIVGPNDNIMLPQDSTQHRLGSRARRRHLAHRAACRRKGRVEIRRRLLHRQRRLRARVPDEAQRLAVEQGQGLRHLRTDRPVAGDDRRDQGPAESRHVARRQRRAPADRQYADDDLRRRRAGRRRVALHDAAARRRHHDRHAARRRRWA